MKKILAISSAFLLLSGVLTGCGSRDDDGYYSDSSGYIADNGRDDHRESRTDSAGEHVKDAIDGVENAGEELVEGVGDAAEDIVDGLDGERTTATKKAAR